MIDRIEARGLVDLILALAQVVALAPKGSLAEEQAAGKLTLARHSLLDYLDTVAPADPENPGGDEPAPDIPAPVEEKTTTRKRGRGGWRKEANEIARRSS